LGIGEDGRPKRIFRKGGESGDTIMGYLVFDYHGAIITHGKTVDRERLLKKKGGKNRFFEAQGLITLTRRSKRPDWKEPGRGPVASKMIGAIKQVNWCRRLCGIRVDANRV